jgi:hypothetical protein
VRLTLNLSRHPFSLICFSLLLLLFTDTTKPMKTITLALVLVATSVAAQERLPETGTFWKWSAPAEHHAASVKVSQPKGAGSGVCVRTEPRACFVLTNWHVVGEFPQVTVTWQDGRKATGDVIRTLAQPIDVALILVRQPPGDWIDLPLAANTPPVGTELEMIGFGGPLYGEARNFVAHMIEPTYSDDSIAMDAPSISGDSGGAMLHNGAIIGINYGGPKVTRYALSKSGKPIGLVYPATSGCNAELLRIWLTGICGPMGCQPQYGQPCQPQFGQPQFIQPNNPNVPRSDEQFYPPKGMVPVPQPIAPLPIVSPQPNIADQLAKNPELINALAERLKKCPELKGDPGKDGGPGPPGKDGTPGADGKDAAFSPEQIAQITAMAAQLAIQKLPPIQVETYDRSGKQIDKESYPYPGPIRLRYGLVEGN